MLGIRRLRLVLLYIEHSPQQMAAGVVIRDEFLQEHDQAGYVAAITDAAQADQLFLDVRRRRPVYGKDLNPDFLYELSAATFC